MPTNPKKLFEGTLLGVAESERTLFYEWDNLARPLHALDIPAEKVWWGEEG